jgi:hypothetical protein
MSTSTDAAAPPQYPFLWTPTIKGRRYAYVRRHGNRVRIPVLPDEPGFDAAYKRALDNLDGPKHGPTTTDKTLAALIRSFQSTRHWRELSPTTRRHYERRCRLLEDRWGASWVPALNRVVC